MSKLPSRVEMLRTLVGIPSISSLDPDLDRSNHEVIDTLAGWAEGLGLHVEVLPVPSRAQAVATATAEKSSRNAASEASPRTKGAIPAEQIPASIALGSWAERRARPQAGPGAYMDIREEPGRGRKPPISPTAECYKANMIATLGQGRGGLVLSGHTDTVPYDQGAWEEDPFLLTEREGRLHGLGAADMKGFLAIMVEVAASIAPARLKAPLILVATADEESTMAGARSLVAAGQPRASQVVIGEPTGLRPIWAHKGVIVETIRLYGQSGHSSDPSSGSSALEGMHRVIGELLSWRSELERRYQDQAFRVPTPTLNFGRIRGGDAANRICGFCELLIDLRPLPRMDGRSLRQELRERVRAAVEQGDLRVEFSAEVGEIPPFSGFPDSTLLRNAVELSGRPSGTAQFCTEAPFFAELGHETIVFGPGDIEVAHRPDEYVHMRDLEDGVRILKALVERHCMG